MFGGGLIIEAGAVFVEGFTNTGTTADVLKEPLVPLTVRLYVVSVVTGDTATVSKAVPGADIEDWFNVMLLPAGKAGELETDSPMVPVKLFPLLALIW